jgi:hypothetical protein
MADVRRNYSDERIMRHLEDMLDLRFGEHVRPTNVVVSFEPPESNKVPMATISTTLVWRLPAEDARAIVDRSEILGNED